MMVIARFIVIFIALAISVSIGMGYITGNRVHYDRAWRLAKFGLAALVIFFVVLIVSEMMR